MLRVTPRSVNPYRSTPLFLDYRFRREIHLLRENKTGCKHPASLYKMVRPERFELPTT
jgi:hypothetical protein